MTPENIARVDAWLIDHGSDTFASIWNTLSGMWLDKHLYGLDTAGPSAAMRGVLLALVREAWNDPHVDVLWSGTMWVCTARDSGSKSMFGDANECDVLIETLEAST